MKLRFLDGTGFIGGNLTLGKGKDRTLGKYLWKRQGEGAVIAASGPFVRSFLKMPREPVARLHRIFPSSVQAAVPAGVFVKSMFDASSAEEMFREREFFREGMKKLNEKNIKYVHHVFLEGWNLSEKRCQRWNIVFRNDQNFYVRPIFFTLSDRRFSIIKGIKMKGRGKKD